MVYIGYKMSKVKLDDLLPPDDNTDLNASSGVHGLLLKLNGDVNTYLRGDGAWAAIGSGGLPANAVRTDQANTYGDFRQEFRSSRLVVARQDGSFANGVRLAGPATQTGEAGIAFPNNLTSGWSFLIDNATQTETNKTIDARSNTPLNFKTWNKKELHGQVNLFEPEPRGEGILAGGSFYGSLYQHFEDGAGMNNVWQTPALANSVAGFMKHDTAAPHFRRENTPLFVLYHYVPTLMFPIADYRLYFGFSSAQILPNSDTPLANADSGFLMGFRKTSGQSDTNYQIFVNDGGGGMPTPTDTGIAVPVALTLHEFEIKMSASNIIWTVRDSNQAQVGTGTITTRIPATNTSMYFYAIVQASTTAQKTLGFKNLEGKINK